MRVSEWARVCVCIWVFFFYWSLWLDGLMMTENSAWFCGMTDMTACQRDGVFVCLCEYVFSAPWSYCYRMCMCIGRADAKHVWVCVYIICVIRHKTTHHNMYGRHRTLSGYVCDVHTFGIRMRVVRIFVNRVKKIHSEYWHGEMETVPMQTHTYTHTHVFTQIHSYMSMKEHMLYRDYANMIVVVFRTPHICVVHSFRLLHFALTVEKSYWICCWSSVLIFLALHRDHFLCLSFFYDTSIDCDDGWVVYVWSMNE